MERITINKNVRGFVKNSAFEVIEKLAKNNNGYITAQMITELNIHRGYLKEMIDMGKIEKITRDLQNEPDFWENIETEHEKMFSEQGIKIKALIAKAK